MATQCTSDAFPLAGLGRRQVVAKFDGGRLSSDGGAVLLRAANQAFQVTGRLAACFIDHRNPARVEHSLESLLGQRVFALALGYEDINDHDRLRDDSLLALAAGSDRGARGRRFLPGHAHDLVRAAGSGLCVGPSAEQSFAGPDSQAAAASGQGGVAARPARCEPALRGHQLEPGGSGGQAAVRGTVLRPWR